MSDRRENLHRNVLKWNPFTNFTGFTADDDIHWETIRPEPVYGPREIDLPEEKLIDLELPETKSEPIPDPPGGLELPPNWEQCRKYAKEIAKLRGMIMKLDKRLRKLERKNPND